MRLFHDCRFVVARQVTKAWRPSTESLLAIVIVQSVVLEYLLPQCVLLFWVTLTHFLHLIWCRFSTDHSVPDRLATRRDVLWVKWVNESWVMSHESMSQWVRSEKNKSFGRNNEIKHYFTLFCLLPSLLPVQGLFLAWNLDLDLAGLFVSSSQAVPHSRSEK